MKQGEYISPFAPYGYEICKDDNNKLVIDLVASGVVRDIFNLYLSGLGFMRIAKYLNDKKIPSPSLYKYQKGIKLNIVSNKPRNEIKWSASAVKSILTNEVYLGHLIQGKRTTVSYKNHKIKNKLKSEWIRCENTHEAIIDEDIFMKVKDMMKERTRVVKKRGMVHIFSGKVFCLECGMYMRKKNSSKYEYLVCSSNYDGYGDCSNNCSIRYDVLEKIVLNKINDMVKKYYDKDLIDKEVMCNEKNDSRKKIIGLEKQRLELEEEIRKINEYFKCMYEDKVNGIISIEQFKSLMDDYKKEEDRFIERIRLIDEEILFYKENDNLRKVDEDIFEGIGFGRLNKIIVDEFINKIYIGKLDREMGIRDIRIGWRF